MPIGNIKPGTGYRRPESSNPPQPLSVLGKTSTFVDGYRNLHWKTRLTPGATPQVPRTRTIVTSKPDPKRPVPPINHQKAPSQTTTPHLQLLQSTYSPKLPKKHTPPKSAKNQGRSQPKPSGVATGLTIISNVNADSFLANNNDVKKPSDEQSEPPISAVVEENDSKEVTFTPQVNNNSKLSFPSGSLEQSGEIISGSLTINDAHSQISSSTSKSTVARNEHYSENEEANPEVTLMSSDVYDSNYNLEHGIPVQNISGRSFGPLFSLHSSNHNEITPQDANKGRRHVCSTTIIRGLELSARLPPLSRSTWIVSPESTVTNIVDEHVGTIDRNLRGAEIAEETGKAEAEVSNEPTGEAHDPGLTAVQLKQDYDSSLEPPTHPEKFEPITSEDQPIVLTTRQESPAQSIKYNQTLASKKEPHSHASYVSTLTEAKLKITQSKSALNRKRQTNIFSSLIQQKSHTTAQNKRSLERNVGRSGMIVKNKLARAGVLSRSAPKRFHTDSKHESGQDFKRVAHYVSTNQERKHLLRISPAENVAGSTESKETKVENDDVPKASNQEARRKDITFSKIVLFYNNGAVISGNIRIKNITSELVYFRISTDEGNAGKFVIDPKEGKLENNKIVIIRLSCETIMTEDILKDVTFKIETVRMSAGATSYTASRRLWMNIQPSSIQTVFTAYSVLFDAKKTFFKHYIKPENVTKGREGEEKLVQPGPSVDLKEVLWDIELAQAEQTKMSRYRTLQFVVAAVLVSIGCVLSCPSLINRITALYRFSKP